MEIPYYILLILYLVGVGIFLVWMFFNLWHLFKFGFFDFTGKLNAFIFIGFSIVIFIITLLLLKDTPWFDTFNPMDIFSGEWFSSDDLESINIDI